MPTRNYYVVLGIPESEPVDGVRRAFRELARRYHPDRAGTHSTPFFQEIVTAYRTLADPQRRASYDAGLHAGQGPPRAAPRPWPDVPAEPLVSQRSNMRRDVRTVWPKDDFFDQVRRDFLAGEPPHPSPMQPLRLELVLSLADALQGGHVDLRIPVHHPCHACRGCGVLAGFVCDRCGGGGLVAREEPVLLRVPAGVRDGHTFDLPLRGLGLHGRYLSVRVRVVP